MSQHSPKHSELHELAACATCAACTTVSGPASTWLRAPIARPRPVMVRRWPRVPAAARRLLTGTLPAASGLALLAFGFLVLLFSA